MNRRSFLAMAGTAMVAPYLPPIPVPAASAVIDGTKIAATSITATKIAVGAITAEKIASESISARTICVGYVNDAQGNRWAKFERVWA